MEAQRLVFCFVSKKSDQFQDEKQFLISFFVHGFAV